MHRKNQILGFVLLVAGTVLIGCDESDVVAARVELKADLSGKVTTCSLVLPTGAGAVESGSETSGCRVRPHVKLVCRIEGD
jgi:hypothetical protein